MVRSGTADPVPEPRNKPCSVLITSGPEHRTLWKKQSDRGLIPTRSRSDDCSVTAVDPQQSAWRTPAQRLPSRPAATRAQGNRGARGARQDLALFQKVESAIRTRPNGAGPHPEIQTGRDRCGVLQNASTLPTRRMPTFGQTDNRSRSDGALSIAKYACDILAFQPLSLAQDLASYSRPDRSPTW